MRKIKKINLFLKSISELHCHSPEAGAANNVDKRARRKLIIASVLCLLFMVVEIVGGVLANSLAIATDAAHLLTDFASFMISLFSIWVASRPATR
jgi:Co/Zn/Cd efflux system component